ncbi:MAG: hypothetical protein VYA97_01450, partial [Pseudomonadota bacterium]|nr:hypothetical protein [Pseudomonadota bacterium]
MDAQRDLFARLRICKRLCDQGIIGAQPGSAGSQAQLHKIVLSRPSVIAGVILRHSIRNLPVLPEPGDEFA